MKTENIKFDSRNYRIHPDNNKRIINKSLKELGAGRSIVIDSNNEIVCGNGVFEESLKLGMPIKVIETNGQELVVVKRTDLKSDDEKRKMLALADNHASDTSVFDMDLVVSDFSEDFLSDWEFSVDDIQLDEFGDDSVSDDTYTKKIVSPIYTPKGEKPEITDLFNLSAYDKLMDEVESADIPKSEKRFLQLAASRHIVFDYGKIAEYYAHAEKPLQDLMENSALVIIDFNKAIELGYVKLKQEIAEQYSEDYGDDEA